MPELTETLALLVQVLVLTAISYLLVLYLTDVSVRGPWDIFERIRTWAGIEKSIIYDLDMKEEVYYEVTDRFWAKVLDCHRCSSPYVAAGVVVLSWLTGLVSPSWTAIILWLAVTGATVLIFELTED